MIIGAVTAEQVSRVREMPKAEEEFHPLQSFSRISGFGWQTSRVFAALRTPYVLKTGTGAGVYGDYVRQAMLQAGMTVPQRTGIQGSTYTLVDENGYAVPMAVPGSEYEFHPEEITQEELQETGTILFSGMELAMNEGSELMHLLKGFGGQLVFCPDGRGVLLDKAVLEQLYQLGVMLYLSEEEAWILNGRQSIDLLQAARNLQAKTHAPVVIWLKDGYALYADDTQELTAGTEMPQCRDLSGLGNIQAAAFTAARNAGLNPSQALQFAVTTAAWTVSSDEVVWDDNRAEQARDLFRQMILK